MPGGRSSPCGTENQRSKAESAAHSPLTICGPLGVPSEGHECRKSSPRQTAWLLLQQPPDAQAYLEELCRRSPEIAAVWTKVLAEEACERKEGHTKSQKEADNV